MPEETTQQVTQVAEGNKTTTQTTADPKAAVWKTEIPTSLRDHEAFASYKTKDELWSGHIAAVNETKDLKGKLSTAIFKPDDKATPEQKEAFFKSLGRPDKPEGYELPPVKLPDGTPYDPALEKQFRAWAFEAGLPKETATAIYSKYMGNYAQTLQTLVDSVSKFDGRPDELAANIFEKMGGKALKTAFESVLQKQRARGEAEARKIWTDAKYDENMTLAKRAVGFFGGAELKAALDESGWGNDPRVLETFRKIGAAIAEDRFPKGTQGAQESFKRDKFGRPTISYPSMQGQQT